MKSVNSLHCCKDIWVFVTLAGVWLNLFTGSVSVCSCAEICLCVEAFFNLNIFLSFPLSTETYEDFDSRVIEVSVSLSVD